MRFGVASVGLLLCADQAQCSVLGMRIDLNLMRPPNYHLQPPELQYCESIRMLLILPLIIVLGLTNQINLIVGIA
jgi:hypothetical protein